MCQPLHPKLGNSGSRSISRHERLTLVLQCLPPIGPKTVMGAVAHRAPSQGTSLDQSFVPHGLATSSAAILGTFPGRGPLDNDILTGSCIAKTPSATLCLRWLNTFNDHPECDGALFHNSCRDPAATPTTIHSARTPLLSHWLGPEADRRRGHAFYRS